MKSVSCAFLIAIIVCGFSLVGVMHFGTVQASTDVTGIISSDTVWTLENSPYSLTGNVLVNNGVTLTIESGATVNLGDFYIMVNGTLRAQGSGTDKINFNSGEITFTKYSSSWNEQTGSGCIIENANLSSTYVGISSVSPKINSNSILRISVGGSAIILHNTISDGITVSSGADPPIISYNTISGGISISQCSPVVLNNTILDGINVSGGSPVISNNTISDGIEVSSSAKISNNAISGGVSVSGSAVISNNTILDGINVSGGSPVISNNTISGGVNVGRGSLVISDNTINGDDIGVNLAPSYNGFLMGWYTDASISGNIISGCTTAGITVGGATSQGGYTPRYNTAIIEGNTIINNYYGIDGARDPIKNNIIANNEYGINGGSLIEGNTIINNDYGIKGGNEIRNNTIVNNSVGVESGFTTLVYNNIYNNSEYNVRFLSSSDANATYNWWGTTDTQAINQTIYDFNNDFYLGTVNFIPFLTEPNSEAPEIPEPEPEQTPTLPTYISISVDASSTVVGSAVNVNGRLTDVNGSALPDKSVTLLYSIAGNDWVPIGSGTTNDTGDYNIQWVNTASGTFTLKVEWIGNDDYLGANANTTLSFLPQQNQKIFFVESNSTVSALTFNSTNTELSFTVSGPSGTTGYVKATIPKDLLYTEGDWSVLVDEQPVIPTVNEDANNTYLYFTYGHSTKTVEIIGTTAILEFPSWTSLLIMLVAVMAVAVIYRSILNKPNEGRKG